MGEFADAILDGEFCESCGEWLGSGWGAPRLCEGCAAERGDEPTSKKKAKVACRTCGKRVRPEGLKQHMLAKHERRP